MSGKKGYKATRRLRNRSKSQRGGKAKSELEFERSDPLNMADAMEDYLAMLEAKNYTADTVEGRRFGVEAFLVWCAERTLWVPSVITLPILESYQRWLHRYRKKNGKPLGGSSQRGRLIAVREFFKWLCRSGRIPWNPASELELPRQEKRLPEDPLSIAQVESILAQPDVSDPLGIRDRCAMELMYSTGMRRCEAVRLESCDVNFERMTVQVRQGKGRKDRVVPVGDRALSWVLRYVEESRPLLALKRGEKALFLTSYGEGFNPDVLSRQVSKYVKRAEIGRGGSCHLFRHACATHMLEGGADTRFIQQLLGHEKLETTQIYTQVSIKQLREVHARTHPGAVKKEGDGD